MVMYTASDAGIDDVRSVRVSVRGARDECGFFIAVVVQTRITPRNGGAR